MRRRPEAGASWGEGPSSRRFPPGTHRRPAGWAEPGWPGAVRRPRRTAEWPALLGETRVGTDRVSSRRGVVIHLINGLAWSVTAPALWFRAIGDQELGRRHRPVDRG